MNPIPIHLLSDSSGNLLDHMLHAVGGQFDERRFELHRHAFIKSKASLRNLLRRLPCPCIVLHALVLPSWKQVAGEQCNQKGIPAHDITGGVTDFLALHLQMQPRNRRSCIHESGEAYRRRIEALEFTLQHDDSRRVESAVDADVVLAGLSRTGKSPISVWLGTLGYKVANISLDPKGIVPEQLEQCRDKLVALRVHPTRLTEIRSRRLAEFNRQIRLRGLSVLPYGESKSVRREVAWADSLFEDLGCPVLDATDLTVEEAAVRILGFLKIDRVNCNA